jgi:hypothetical protein
MSKHQSFEKWAATAGSEAETEDRRASKALAKMKSDRDASRRLQRLAEEEAERADDRLAIALALREAPVQAKPVKPRGRKGKARNRGLPVLMCSDWHVEERVDKKQVNGRNEYNPTIARQRIEYLAAGMAWLVNQWAKGWDITELVLWFGGDMISGYIHEELVESNWLSPTEAVLLAQELMALLIDHLLQACPYLERIRVFCNYGNHGRTTQKRRVSTSAANSFEWLAYHSLKQRYAKDPRVAFDIADGAHLYAELYGLNVRFHHGDDVRYAGGVGGLSIPLRKACDSWDKFIEAPLTIVGHWHQLVDYMYAAVNGSVIGYNAYALSIKARYEPPRQGAFMIDEEWGKRLFTPVYCDQYLKTS